MTTGFLINATTPITPDEMTDQLAAALKELAAALREHTHGLDEADKAAAAFVAAFFDQPLADWTPERASAARDAIEAMEVACTPARTKIRKLWAIRGQAPKIYWPAWKAAHARLCPDEIALLGFEWSPGL
jgi:hypothetical protein